ncbi:uncharacterized protein BJ171DRAFT_446664 [Polychytrium aggregatum]|uniref:uncharacterized protein n=1 Tax=Polychytrium aggregatum TaxID=110093 RepID=UPI0022FE5CE6|nr:uncharacterized protein BJ171DRAFT_446664 [Polychytrium aggregatum]KAI9197087.1 hypothetical protein BJ171DRAFT_446664 [Polychytrium aggregatum]
MSLIAAESLHDWLRALALLAAWPEQLLQHYIRTDAILTAWALVAVFTLVTWTISTITRNYSQVDRIWSITPFIYAIHFAVHAAVHNGVVIELRTFVMALLTTLWGLRLTFNFYRKGGYDWYNEDYRWSYCRRIVDNPLLWELFSFFFISVYQHLLLFGISLPSLVAYKASLLHGPAFTALDGAAAIGFAALLVFETVADQQQWNFQSEKYRLLAVAAQREAAPARSASETLEQKQARLLATLPHPFNIGFITSGLFRYSRHPNFFAEQAMWWTFNLFAVSAAQSFWIWTWTAPLLLSLLFLGSTALTEWITEQKYPLYKEYKKTTSTVIPWIPGKPILAAQKDD